MIITQTFVAVFILTVFQPYTQSRSAIFVAIIAGCNIRGDKKSRAMLLGRDITGSAHVHIRCLAIVCRVLRNVRNFELNMSRKIANL